MSEQIVDTEFERGKTEVNGIQMHYIESGSESKPVIVLLHGFPEFWYAWSKHIELLKKEGYRVVAPDLRGYNLTDQSDGVSSYTLPMLGSDISELVESLHVDEAIFVGHDWGGIIAWWLASEQPTLLSHLVTINAPHPAISFRELQKPSKIPSSWYFFFYQLPVLPELLMRAGNFSLMDSAFREDTTTENAFTETEIEQYKEMMSDPGLLTSAINYDRGLFRMFLGETFGSWIPGIDGDPGITEMNIEVPTLVLWGLQDRYYHPGLLDGLERWVNDLTLFKYQNASHWFPAEHPNEVIEQIIKFV